MPGTKPGFLKSEKMLSFMLLYTHEVYWRMYVSNIILIGWLYTISFGHINFGCCYCHAEDVSPHFDIFILYCIPLDPLDQLDVLWHQHHSLSMIGYEVHIFKQINDIGLCCLLHSQQGHHLKVEVTPLSLGGLPHPPGKWEFPDQKAHALLILRDLLQGYSAWAESPSFSFFSLICFLGCLLHLLPQTPHQPSFPCLCIFDIVPPLLIFEYSHHLTL